MCGRSSLDEPSRTYEEPDVPAVLDPDVADVPEVEVPDEVLLPLPILALVSMK
jgi:hypothetical protein